MGETTTEFGEAFDPSKEEGTSSSLLPSGWYQAEIVDTSVSVTKNKKGQMFNVSFQVQDEGGEYDRRWLFAHILFQHESADATKFGRQRIKDLCDAVGVTEAVTNVDVFKYRKCWIYVGIEKDKTGEYPDKNKVARFKSLEPVVAAPVDMKAALDDEIPGFER